MRTRPIIRGLVFGTALVGLTALTAQGVSVARPATVADVHAATKPVPTTTLTGPTSDTTARRVLLPDGRQVTLLASGGVVADQGASMSLAQTATGYEVSPQAAGPLGLLVDPAAYNVSTLADLEAKSGGRLPLAVSYAGTRPSLPGLTWTAAHAGYLTTASAATFGAALRTKAATDVTHIALPGPTTITPQYVQHTITLKSDVTGTDANSVTAYFINVDDESRWRTSVLLQAGGQAKLSLPDGHYAVVGFFSGGSARLVVTSLTVSSDRTFTIKAAQANAPLTVSTPRPANVVDISYAVDIVDGMKQYRSFIELGQPVLVSPLPKNAPFTVLTQAQFHLVSDQSAADPYTYDLAFSGTAIAKNQHYVATPETLAAVHASFYDDGESAPESFAMVPLLPGPSASDAPLPVGTNERAVTSGVARTQYTSAGFYWEPVLDNGSLNEFFSSVGSPRAYTAGSTPELGLVRGPLHPGFAVPATPAWNLTNPRALPGCVLCRNGDNMLFGFNALADEDGDNSYILGGINITLDRNGKPILQVPSPLPLGTGVQVAAGTASYTLHYDLARPQANTSTLTNTVWTFKSGETTGAEQGNNVECGDPFVGAIVYTCRVEDLLNDTIDLPQDLHSTEQTGPTSARITVTHAPGSTVHPITAFSAQVSFDAGKTWQPTTITTATGDGSYQVAYTNPTGATAAALRVHAVDSKGSAFDQTIYRAYLVH